MSYESRATSHAKAMSKLDYLIKNAQIVDGTGGPSRCGYLGIKGERVECIGTDNGAAADQVIDAAGKFLTPGFIDIHDHSDGVIEAAESWDARQAGNLLSQGVTTVLGGNCGSSPLLIGEHLGKVDAGGMGVNYGVLIGHGSIREEYMEKKDVKPTLEDMEEMSNALRRALEEGAFGLSSGLAYLPGCFADTEELVALSRVLAEKGGIYASHVRNEDEGVIEAVAEAIDIGRQAGVPVQISHLKCSQPSIWGESTKLLEMIERAGGEGLDVSCDQYPYLASYTGLADKLVPVWAREGDDLVGRLRDGGLAGAIKEAVKKALLDLGGGKNVLLTSCAQAEEYEGKRISEVAQELEIDEVATVLRLVKLYPDISAIYFCMSEDDVQEIMRHPATFIGTDGGAKVWGRGVVHPRNYGTFPRVLARYVREKRILGFSEAIAKMTSRPAKKLGLKERGELRRGCFADLVLLDPERVNDRATYEQNHNYAEGISHVFVNGKLVVNEGERLPDILAGKVLRGGE